MVLNLRGMVLGCARDVRRAGESYQAAAAICEERGDMANWAVAQANRGTAARVRWSRDPVQVQTIKKRLDSFCAAQSK